MKKLFKQLTVFVVMALVLSSCGEDQSLISDNLENRVASASAEPEGIYVNLQDIIDGKEHDAEIKLADQTIVDKINTLQQSPDAMRLAPSSPCDDDAISYREDGSNESLALSCCCALDGVVLQNNPWWVGADLQDRNEFEVTNWYLKYKGYNHENNLLIHDITIEVPWLSCGSDHQWPYWFGIPIDPNYSYHPNCNTDGRAEFYLYKEYNFSGNLQLCKSVSRVWEINLPNQNPCL